MHKQAMTLTTDKTFQRKYCTRARSKATKWGVCQAKDANVCATANPAYHAPDRKIADHEDCTQEGSDDPRSWIDQQDDEERRLRRQTDREYVCVSVTL